MILKCTSKKEVAVCVYGKIFLDECQQLILIRPLLIWNAKFLFEKWSAYKQIGIDQGTFNFVNIVHSLF